MQQQHSELDYSAEYQPVNPLAAFATFLAGVLLLIIVVAGLIAGWHTFLAEASTIVQVVVTLAIVAIPVTIVGIGAHKGHMAWIAAQMQREALGAVRDKRRMDLERHALDLELARTRIAADERGNRPTIYDATKGIVINLPSGNFSQNVPQTYSPHITYAKGETRVQEIENEQAALPAPDIEQPTLSYCINQLEENALQVCLGVSSSTGKPFVINLLDGVHYKFIGASGMGKSCLAAAILAQALKTNDPDTLQVALLDLEHKTSRLFENMPHVAELNAGRRIVPLVATDANQVAFQLSLLHKELDRRAAMSEQVLSHERFMLIYVEEFLSLQYEVDEEAKARMLADFSILAVRGRKYGMYLLACAQVDYADNDLRNAKAQFRVKGAFGVVPSAAASAGFMSKELVKQNYLAQQPGQFVLETRGCNDIMLAPQYDVKARLARMNGGSGRQSGGVQTVERPYVSSFNTDSLNGLNDMRTGAVPIVNGSIERSERAIEADASHVEDVKRLIALNWGKQAIIEKVWNVRKGGSAAYKSAAAEYEAIIARLESEN